MKRKHERSGFISIDVSDQGGCSRVKSINIGDCWKKYDLGRLAMVIYGFM